MTVFGIDFFLKLLLIRFTCVFSCADIYIIPLVCQFGSLTCCMGRPIFHGVKSATLNISSNRLPKRGRLKTTVESIYHDSRLGGRSPDWNSFMSKIYIFAPLFKGFFWGLNKHISNGSCRAKKSVLFLLTIRQPSNIKHFSTVKFTSPCHMP